MSLSKELLEEQFRLKNWELHKIYPELETHIGQNSIDVTLSPYVYFTDKDFPYLLEEAKDNQYIKLKPNDFILGAVNERIDCSNPVKIKGEDKYFYPCIETRSTLARKGICSHISAGLGDYGFNGFFTLEIFNFSPYTHYLQPKTRFAQITFRELITGGIKPKSKYKSIYNTYDNKPILPK